MHSQSNSQYIKAKVNSSHLTKKMELARDALKKAEKASELKEQELVERKQQIEELKRSWRNYEEKAREEEVSRERHIELDEDQVCVDAYLFKLKLSVVGGDWHRHSGNTPVLTTYLWKLLSRPRFNASSLCLSQFWCHQFVPGRRATPLLL